MCQWAFGQSIATCNYSLSAIHQQVAGEHSPPQHSSLIPDWQTAGFRNLNGLFCHSPILRHVCRKLYPLGLLIDQLDRLVYILSICLFSPLITTAKMGKCRGKTAEKSVLPPPSFSILSVHLWSQSPYQDKSRWWWRPTKVGNAEYRVWRRKP